MGDEENDLVIKAVLRDCADDMLMSDLAVGPLATHLVSTEHFTEEESLKCHAEENQEEAMKIFIDILNTKTDDVLDAIIEYLENKNQKQPHLHRCLTAARERRRLNPYDEEDVDPNALEEGDFWLTLGGVEIIRNQVMASPTSKGKWLDIALHIIKAPGHIAKLKSVNAGRPEKMIDMSLEFWIRGTESDFRPHFKSLIQILEERKMKKLAEALEKVKGKLQAACEASNEMPAT